MASVDRFCPRLRDAFGRKGRERGFNELKRRTGMNDHTLLTHLGHLQEGGEVRQTRLRGPYALGAPGGARVTHHQLSRVVLPPAELSFRGELTMKVTRHDGHVEY